jgi:hypothetical protein
MSIGPVVRLASPTALGHGGASFGAGSPGLVPGRALPTGGLEVPNPVLNEDGGARGPAALLRDGAVPHRRQAAAV